jgi:hypothetical protein
MEKIMSKTNDTSKPRELTEAEFDAVSGGFWLSSTARLAISVGQCPTARLM